MRYGIRLSSQWLAMRVLLIALSLVVLCGCDMGFQQLEAGEHGVVFSALPPWLAGGIEEKLVAPGEKEFIYPWETLYRVDTSTHVLEWGGVGEGNRSDSEDYVKTRAQDGNEVGLAMAVFYHVDPARVRHIVEYVADSDEELSRFVEVVARADIRTHMNVLRTRDFFSQEAQSREEARSAVQKALNARLNPDGIIVDSVVYKGHVFYRQFEVALDGGEKETVSYQQILENTQAKRQETEEEKKRRAAVEKRKIEDYERAQGDTYAVLEEARRYREEQRLRAEAYLKQKENEAVQIREEGMAMVEGRRREIAALSGPGGEAILRLAIIDALMKAKPRFVLLNQTGRSGGGVDLNKIDTNELLRQMGLSAAVHEGMQEGNVDGTASEGSPAR